MLPIEQEIRQFIIDNFLYGDEEVQLSVDDSLLEQGIIDSTGVLELVGFLESKYGIEISHKELLPTNFDSIDKLIRLVQRKMCLVE